MSIFPSGMFSVDPKSTPEQLAQRKALMAMLRPKYGSARYVGEGLGQLATGIVAGLQNRKMREIEGAGRDSANDLFSGLFGKTSQSTAGGRPGPMNILGVDPSMMAPPSEGAAVADDTMRALGKTPMRPYRDAIAGIESAGSGDYAAVGPTHPKMGRALGRYQIMESNIGPWSKEALGREVTPEEFMANPAIQDAIFDHKFGGYVEKYGPEGAAQAWLGGPGGVGKVTREDSLGTSIGEYGQKFMGALGGPVAAPAGASTATNSTTPPIDPQALAAALANPWISPEQRAMLTTIYDQQVQAGDPMRQIEIAKGVAELDAMNNPPAPEQPEQLSRLAIAKEMGLDDESARVYALTGELPQTADANVPAAFASLDMQAQAAGFAPGTPEYQEFMRNGGGSGTPAAFTALDMQAKAAGFEPGEPEYQEFMATRGAGFVAAAKAKGEDRATLESLESKMPGLEEVVGQLNALAEKATYTYTGQALDFAAKQLGLEPREAAVARAEYIAMVDNQVLPLLRDTFGAAFTVKEGETLRATLGDPNKSPQEKKAVLDAFIEQKKRDVAALKSRTGMSADQPPAAIPQGVDPALWEFMTPEERALFQ